MHRLTAERPDPCTEGGASTGQQSAKDIGIRDCTPKTPICLALSNATGSPYAEIPLTSGGVAIVDEADFEMLSVMRWRANDRGYVVTWSTRDPSSRGYSKMHRMVMLPEPGQEIDHINGDKLDNRRANLRVCTRAENNRNRSIHRNNQSGLKGVFWHSRDRRWRAKIQVDGQRLHLGNFADKADAARAYDIAATEHFGEFAVLNFPAVTP
jgi:HNH endonuclease/AP2 domain